MLAPARPVAALLLLLGLLLAGCAEGTLREAEERARLAWGEVHLQDRRRAELLPAMLAMVRDHAPQEREILAELAAALRASAAPALDEGTPRDPVRWREFLTTRIRLSSAIQDLLAAVERYLDLKRSAGFLALKGQLTEIQSRMAVARRDYNAAARAYNAELDGWWSGRVARLRHPEARPLQLFTGLAEE